MHPPPVKLIVAIASRALFDFEEENRLFEAGDDRAYMARQLELLDLPAKGGVAMPLVKKLLAFNDETERRVDVVLLSRNDPTSGMRAFRSAHHHGVPLERGVFTRGRPPYAYLKPLGAHLFLSANADDVRAALEAGFPAARVYPQSPQRAESHPDEVRIAFDGDAVLRRSRAGLCQPGPVGLPGPRGKPRHHAATSRPLQAAAGSALPPAPGRTPAHAYPNGPGDGPQRPGA